jgi:thiol-disulfide isomerase/thioredoxin
MSSYVKPGTAAKKPDRRKIALYATLAILVVAVVVAVALSSTVPKAAVTPIAQKAGLTIGGKAPDFSVSTTGGPFTLSTTPTPVLLEIFATWCPHCQHETAVMNQLQAKYRGKVAIVAVSGSELAIDGSTPASQEDVVQFGEHFNTTYPLAYDPSLDVAKKYIQGGFPTIVLIDKNKNVSWFADGEIPLETIEKQIDALPSISKT